MHHQIVSTCFIAVFMTHPALIICSEQNSANKGSFAKSRTSANHLKHRTKTTPGVIIEKTLPIPAQHVKEESHTSILFTRRRCFEMLNHLKRTYSSNPEHLEIIQKELEKCMQAYKEIETRGALQDLENIENIVNSLECMLAIAPQIKHCPKNCFSDQK